jgi:predicted transcriptional regulator
MAAVIPKQPKKERDQITIKLDRDVLENLEHYCRYLESSRDYVINQCLVFIFRKDRAFSEWLANHGLAVCAASSGTAAEHAGAKPVDRKTKTSPAQGRLPIAERGE